MQFTDKAIFKMTDVYTKMRVMANPVRLEILANMGGNSLPPAEIQEELSFNISPSQLSQHLGKLKHEGILKADVKKGRPFYRVDKESLDLVVNAVTMLQK